MLDVSTPHVLAGNLLLGAIVGLLLALPLKHLRGTLADGGDAKGLAVPGSSLFALHFLAIWPRRRLGAVVLL